MNWLDQGVACCIFMAVATLNYPLIGLMCSVVIVVGRIMYSIGYDACGVKGRMIGSFGGLGMMVAFGTAIASIFKAIVLPGTETPTQRIIPF